MNIIDYKLVCLPEKEIEQGVRDLIKEGWQPYGCPKTDVRLVQITPNDLLSGHIVVVTQSLVKYEQRKPKLPEKFYVKAQQTSYPEGTKV